MKEEEKKTYNEWIKDNAEKVKYVKLFIDAFERSFFILSDIENESERGALSYRFISEIYVYIQARKISSFNTDNKRLNAVLDKIKSGIDGGFIDCMDVCNRTEKATETRKQNAAEKAAKNADQNAALMDDRKAFHRELFFQAVNKVNQKYWRKIEPKRNQIKEALEGWYNSYLQQDITIGDLPFRNPKSKQQDEKNSNVERIMLNRAAELFGKAIGEHITVINGNIM